MCTASLVAKDTPDLWVCEGVAKQKLERSTARSDGKEGSGKGQESGLVGLEESSSTTFNTYTAVSWENLPSYFQAGALMACGGIYLHVRPLLNQVGPQ